MPMKLRAGWVAIALMSGSVLAGPVEEMLKDTITQQALNAVLPEDLPRQKLPKYIEDSPIDLAEAQAFGGRYKTALLTLFNAPDADPVRAAVVRGTCNWRLGRIDEALAALGDEKVAADPRVQVLTAEILADTGRHADAIDLLNRHLEAHPTSLAGRYQLGRVYELSGDILRAREAYAWFTTPPHNYFDLWAGQGEMAFNTAEELTIVARALDRDATLNSKYKDAHLHNMILNMFVKAYDVMDREYYPARIAAAEFLLNRSSPEKAMELLEAANNANPRHPTIDRLIGEAMIYRQPALTEATIDSLREVNPRSADADVLEAKLKIAQRKQKAAEAILNRVIAANPRRLDALGLLAGLQWSSARVDEARQTLNKADAVDPNQSEAYIEAATILYRRHQHGGAIEFLKTAVERAPWSVEARNLLGNVYMHSGDDDLARATLEAAYVIDPFNIETVNFLKLLDATAKWQRYETDHFIFQYDPIDDPIVPIYIAPYMEQAYKEVTAPLKFEPPQKTIIQIYPTAQTFSVRMAGQPGIETYAAAMGRLIIASSPRAGQSVGAFNWARVIKHEFAHTCHLTMTDARVPRWVTEGLAVMVEEVEFRFPEIPEEMYKRAMAGKLYKISELDSVFQRPRGKNDGEVAYMTGFWIGRYMLELAGQDAINRLLLAYRDGKTDEEAVRAAVNMGLEEFDKKFADWAKKQVENWGYDKETAAKYKKAFDRGEEKMKANQLDEAWAAFSEANQLQPYNHMPHRRLAAIAMKQKKPDAALVHLRWLVPLEFRDNRFAKSVAMLYKQQDDVAKAIEFAELAVKTDPYDPLAHDLLGELYQKAGDERAMRETEVASLLRLRADEAAKPKDATKED